MTSIRDQNMESPRIKIFSRSMDDDLYQKAISLVKLPYPKVRCINTSADGYFYQMLEDTETDIAINIDEDAFVCDMDALKSLLDYALEHNYVNCGMPDGGMVHMRTGYPIVTNPFFNILNLKEIRKDFSFFKMYIQPVHRERYMKKFPKEFLKNDHTIGVIEPYYYFFIWLSQHYKTLYLEAETHQDGTTTILKNHIGQPFLMHTWHARYYTENGEHKQRVDRVIAECIANQPTAGNEIAATEWTTMVGKTYAEPIYIRFRRLIKSYRKRGFYIPKTIKTLFRS